MSEQEKGPLGDFSAAIERLIHYFRGKGYLLKLLMCMDGYDGCGTIQSKYLFCVLVPGPQLLKPLASPE